MSNTFRNETNDRPADRKPFESAAGGVREAGETVSARLKTAGVDTDVMVEAAKEQAGQLQDMIASEIKNRPFQAIGLAALAGFWFGLRR